MAILIADSGATKCEWCLVQKDKKKTIITLGISPYFLSEDQILALLTTKLLPKLRGTDIREIYFYGTGLANPGNKKIIQKVLRKLFPGSGIDVQTDLMGIARASSGNKKGIACILGTGSNSCYYDGKKIVKNNPSLGYVLGDEGSGAYLGKKVIQHYLHNTFDEDLRSAFEKRFETTSLVDILDRVYKQPLANRFMASYALFLAENRGHYMIENILEDGLNDFFFTHLYKYSETWTLPIHFVGSIGFGFRDVLKQLCDSHELELGKILKAPMPGLIEYHR
jgi:glucosamine kinase